MKRRTCEIDWIRGIRDQCQRSGTPFFLKQIVKNGKINKSSVLDGQTWQEFPRQSRNGAMSGAETGTPPEPLGDVRGVSAEQKKKTKKKFDWKVEAGARRNYRLLGARLAARGDLYRNGTEGQGLIQVLPSGKPRLILKGAHLAPVIVDRVPMVVTKEGKVVSELPTASHLNAMLHSEEFLGRFKPVDEVARTSFYLDDLSTLTPGYNDCGPGSRILYLGDESVVADTLDTINRFLDVMPFACNADRTNTLAAALTVLLRRQWQGEKPLILITSTRSHAGKGTLTEFIRGPVPKADILYESLDWPMQTQFQKQIHLDTEIGLVVFDNVRLDSSGGRARFIRSAFVESFVTSTEVILASPSAGEPIRLKNKYVVTINTNDGTLSTDLMNRSLPIHLAPTGDLHERPSDIGNPKLEFLPQNRGHIEAELRGMIERWKAAGSPLDEDIWHPMSNWARTIGGILKVNGFLDFLANTRTRKSADDPLREALSILGAAKPGEKLCPMEWAELVVEEGLAKTLFSANERDTPKGRERAIGGVLKRHLGVVFEAASEQWCYRLRLEGGFRRWVRGKNPHTKYVFTVLHKEKNPAED